ncbi:MULTISPECIES: PEP-CTERM sorting domain-containing protein [Lentisalinibacter]|uniref:PEP-CTERM sorting domain-containing protein n=1 Tax=Lentisalinibacter TaxID=3382081 RepID=UPI003865DC09
MIMKNRSCYLRGLTLVPALLLLSLSAHALPALSFTETDEGAFTRYDFVLDAEPGDLIFELALDLSVAESSVIDVFSPVNWGSLSDPFAPGFLAFGDNGSGGTFVSASADFGSELFGPARLSGFGVRTSELISDPISFSLNFGVETFLAQRITDEPSAVPEPGTLPLMGLALIALVVRSRKRKRISTRSLLQVQL